MIEPYIEYENYCIEQDKLLSKLPVCCECEEHITQDSAVKIDGRWYCDACLKDMREEVTFDD